MNDRAGFKMGAVCIAALLLMAPGAKAFVAGSAQNQTDKLSAQLADEQSQVHALQLRLTREETRADAIDTADLFGPSDEEKAAVAQREQTQDSNIATLNQRAGDIEESLRRLTGQIEVLGHRLDETDQRIERLRKEFDYKLCALSAQQLGASTTTAMGDTGALPCPSTAPESATQSPSPGVTRLAPPPGILGTLPQGTALPQAAPESPPAVAPAQTAGIDTHAQFEAAMNMLARSQYDEARAAFRNFADTYPKDPLAAQALYWLGDVAFVQKDFSSAAHTFAEELKKYPQSPRAPESLLKLGQALLATNQKQEGCTTLAVLISKYPSASKTVIGQAEAVRKAGGCHR